MPYPYDLDYEAKKFKVQPLKTDRNGWKFIILNLLTLGIYSIIFFISLSFDLDKAAPKSDRSKTPNFLAAYILSLFTFSIFLFIWHYHVADRIDDALGERKIPYNFGTDTFWTLYFFGSFILIGPLVYVYKLCHAMNLLCEKYNEEEEQKNAARK